MTAKEKTKEIADSLRINSAIPSGLETGKQEKTAPANQDELSLLVADEELRELYRLNAGVGSEHLTGDLLPMLKVHSPGKSLNNELADGSEPNTGWFFHTKAKKQYQTIEAHVLLVSRGFYAKGLEAKKPRVYTQLIAGMIIEDMAPFIMYVTGLKLQDLWDFGKAASQYTKNKAMPIPLFALKVRFSTYLKSHSMGKSYVVKFELVKDEKGNPAIVADKALFQILRDGVDYVEPIVESIIERGEIAKEGEDPALEEQSLQKEAEKVFTA